MKTCSFRKVIRILRENFPVSSRVKVNRLLMKNGFLAITNFSNGFFRIQISSSQCSELQFDALLHEWAHVCAIDREANYCHDIFWGGIYGTIYETLVDKLEIRIKE